MIKFSIVPLPQQVNEMPASIPNVSSDFLDVFTTKEQPSIYQSDGNFISKSNVSLGLSLATKNLQGTISYSRGDLIEVVFQKTRHVLGIILSIEKDNGNSLICLLWMPSKSCSYNFQIRTIMTFSVKFQIPNWLQSFSSLQESCIREILSRTSSTLVNSPVLDRLQNLFISFENQSSLHLQHLLKTYPDLESKLLSSNTSSFAPLRRWSPEEFLSDIDNEYSYSPEIIHAAYRLLFSNSKMFVKPPYLGPNGPYFLRPVEEIKKIEAALAISALSIEEFKNKLKAHLGQWRASLAKSNHANSFTFICSSETDKLLLWVLQMYASAHQNNFLGANGHPLAPLISRILSGIIDTNNNPGDLYSVLEKTGLLEPDFNVHWGQSCLQYDLPIEIKKEDERLSNVFIPKALEDGFLLKDRIEFDESYLAIAIDSPDTIEVDDAISVEPDNPNLDYWTIHIHVADPTAIIPRGSLVDKFCAQRTSSIYVPETKALMLPPELVRLISISPSLTSIRKHSLAFTFSFNINKKSGKLIETDFHVRPSILKNVRRLTYEEADYLISCKDESEVGQVLSLLTKIIFILSPNTLENSPIKKILSLIHNRPSAEVKLEELESKSGSTITILNNNDPSSISRKIISELMVLAGIIGARFAQSHNILVPYRIQNSPSEVMLEEIFIKLAALEECIHPSSTTFNAVGSYLVTSFTSALGPFLGPSRVSLSPQTHWTMGLDSYLRVTSPMRRYADMLVHYQLKAAISKEESHSLSSLDVMNQHISNINELEPQLKSLQRRATRFWILTYILRQGHAKIWDGAILGKLLSNTPSTTSRFVICQFYIFELFSTFSVLIDSHMLQSFGFHSFQQILKPGTTIQVTLGTLKRDLNQVTWRVASIAQSHDRLDYNSKSIINPLIN